MTTYHEEQHSFTGEDEMKQFLESLVLDAKNDHVRIVMHVQSDKWYTLYDAPTPGRRGMGLLQLLKDIALQGSIEAVIGARFHKDIGPIEACKVTVIRPDEVKQHTHGLVTLRDGKLQAHGKQ